ncbi:MAG: glycosyltransferase [bacterium]|jgi:GT2 family glycosyltransferase|nr:glycosyltransferase [candidate division KSB1 bacterium]MDH7558756.1 glycosyltransferase [bacterium]
MSAAPELAIIIVSYNVRDFLEQALTSVRKAVQGIAAEVWVVDNASTDGTVAMVGRSFPGVRLIANQRNVGFAAANNQVLRQSEAQVFCLLNPDTVVQEDTFRTLLAFLRAHPDVGMVGCKILNPDGSLQQACRRSIPTPWVAFTKLVGLSRLFPRSKLFGRYNLTYLDPDKTYEVEAISGSFMMVRREAVAQVGLLDETFFLYGEDLDWCLRFRNAGWKVYYVPETKIVHFKGESSRRSGFDSLRLFYQAMHLFVRKHFASRSFFPLRWFLVLAIWLRAALSFFNRAAKVAAVPVVDLALMYVAVTVAVEIWFGNLVHLPSFLAVNAFYSLVWLACLAANGCYGARRYSSTAATAAVLAGLVINSAWTFFFKQYGFSRAVVLISGVLNLVLISGWRILVRLLPRLGLPFRGTLGKSLLKRRTLLVGDRRSVRDLLRRLRSRFESAYEVVGVVSLDGAASGEEMEGVPVFAASGQLDELFRAHRVQEVIFSTDRIPYDRILDLMDRANRSRVSFKLVPSHLEVIIGKASIDSLAEIPLVEVEYRFSSAWHRFVKRVLDLAVALPGLVLVAPVMLYLVVARGYRLRRRLLVGREGKLVAAHELVARDGTRSSRLPLLWDVLVGNLTLVGAEFSSEPSPEVPKQLKPGITGITQLKGSRALTSKEKERQLLYYMKNYSLWLDVEILIKAVLDL